MDKLLKILLAIEAAQQADQGHGGYIGAVSIYISWMREAGYHGMLATQQPSTTAKREILVD